MDCLHISICECLRQAKTGCAIIILTCGGLVQNVLAKMVIDRVPSVEMVSDPSAICSAAAPVVAMTFGFVAAKV